MLEISARCRCSFRLAEDSKTTMANTNNYVTQIECKGIEIMAAILAHASIVAGIFALIIFILAK